MTDDLGLGIHPHSIWAQVTKLLDDWKIHVVVILSYIRTYYDLLVSRLFVMQGGEPTVPPQKNTATGVDSRGKSRYKENLQLYTPPYIWRIKQNKNKQK